MQKAGAAELGYVQGKIVKAGDLVMGIYPHKAHATHLKHLDAS